ncbi:unnamed protein product, partial [Cuscuta epithymum]
MAQSDDEVCSTSDSISSSVGTALNDDPMSSFWEEFQTIQATYSFVKDENSRLKVDISDLRKETECKLNLLTEERDRLKAENESLLKRIRDIEELESRYNSLLKMQSSMKNIGDSHNFTSGLGYVEPESGEPSVRPSTKVAKAKKVIVTQTLSPNCHASTSGTKVVHEKVIPEKQTLKAKPKQSLKTNESGRNSNQRKSFQKNNNQRPNSIRQSHDNSIRNCYQKG